jgi:hypothetical protein
MKKKAEDENNGYIVIKYVFKNQLRNMMVLRSGAKTKPSANTVKKFGYCRLCSGSAAPCHQQPIKGSVWL